MNDFTVTCSGYPNYFTESSFDFLLSWTTSLEKLVIKELDSYVVSMWQIAKLKNLRCLSLGDARINNKALDEIINNCEHLTELRLKDDESDLEEPLCFYDHHIRILARRGMLQILEIGHANMVSCEGIQFFIENSPELKLFQANNSEICELESDEDIRRMRSWMRAFKKRLPVDRHRANIRINNIKYL